MIITFLGHRNLSKSEHIEKIVRDTVLHITEGTDNVVFYCGGYGDFDNICARACKALKQIRKGCETVLVVPYITESFQRRHKELEASGLYDASVYPPIEDAPLRFAISKRNEWMIDEADLVIFYVEHNYGGAYNGLRYALRRGKATINLAEHSSL